MMPTYYKATRCDGTSFHDGKTAWKVGRITRHPKPDLSQGLCSAGVGPNGSQVVALIEQAKTITWDVARGAARAAAAEVAPARVAAWDAAWDVAWGAAWGAAGALVVRDLITPETFAILAGPWESVMGTVVIAKAMTPPKGRANR